MDDKTGLDPYLQSAATGNAYRLSTKVGKGKDFDHSSFSFRKSLSSENEYVFEG
jgi:hypothetical protein